MPAKSEKQKKFFGAVMGAKKGQKGVKGAAKKTAKKMTKKQIKKYLKKESFNDAYYKLLEQTEGLADWEIGVEESPEYMEGEAREDYEAAMKDEVSVEEFHDLLDNVKELMVNNKIAITSAGPVLDAFRTLISSIKLEIKDMEETSDTHYNLDVED
jgi:adenosine deaminase